MSRIYNDINESIGNTPLVQGLNRPVQKHGAAAGVLFKPGFINPLAACHLPPENLPTPQTERRNV
jgi:cysteine synthase